LGGDKEAKNTVISSKIGNALTDGGIVFDDAYGPLTDSVTPISPYSRRFTQFQEVGKFWVKN
jgi:hypothetical protein